MRQSTLKNNFRGIFMSIYREYDIRGIFEEELNEASVVRIGYGLASRIAGEVVAVGYDGMVLLRVLR